MHGLEEKLYIFRMNGINNKLTYRTPTCGVSRKMFAGSDVSELFVKSLKRRVCVEGGDIYSRRRYIYSRKEKGDMCILRAITV